MGRDFGWRTRVAIVAVILTFVLPQESRTQTLRFDQPPRDQVLSVLASLPAGDRKNILDVEAEVFPAFIFLPGIMGSKLTKILPDGKTVPIWGVHEGVFASPNEHLAYSESDVVKAEILEEYYALGRSVDIYGQATGLIRSMDYSNGKIFFPFPYDWRQSNRDSAADFSKWLCDVKAEIGRRPVVFIAHSMGGLVLKYWLSKSFEATQCANDPQKFSDWIKIKRIIFLGTPHFGAPKAITAFADRHYLLVDPDSIAGKVFGGLDASVLSRSINAYGATFPSAYELLPVVNTTNCFNDATWPRPIRVRQADGSTHDFIDIFSEHTWQSFKWPRMLSSTISRASFVKERLPKLLESAKSFQCELARFEPQKKFDVVRFFGRSAKTVCTVTIVLKNSADPAEVETASCDEPSGGGDGTVPMWIAAEAERSDVDSNRPTTSAHVALLSSWEFINYLRDYRNQLHRELQARYKTRFGNVSGLTKMYAGLRYVVPADLGAGESNATSEVARSVLAALAVEPSSIYSFAKNNVLDPLERANAYQAFANFSDTSQNLNRIWALNNAAHILLSQGMFERAFRLGKGATDASNAMNTNSKITGNAALVAALAAEKLKEFDLAKQYGAIAFTAGNAQARRFSN